jgi:DNA-binding NtrC family response regulator
MAEAVNVFDERTLQALNAGLRRGGRARPAPKEVSEDRYEELYGTSPEMRQLFALIERVAPTNAMVMLKGESGTGKELVAQALHERSGLAHAPFLAINCGAIPANLVEAELFGHERGSFTGAVRMRKGCFERANGGTLFLDEVTEMPVEMQVKLLRALETGRFCRVGGDQEIQVRLRIIAATNRCPESAVRAGTLRSDLLYRLSVIRVEIPPLRERGADVELLARRFLDRLNAEAGTAKRLSDASLRFLYSHRWPGNVRELKNMVQRAHVLADGELELEGAAEPGAAGTGAHDADHDRIVLPVGTSLAESERCLIRATLARCGGNKTRAAELLGVSLKTLYNRLHAYGEGLARADAGAAPAGTAIATR